MAKKWFDADKQKLLLRLALGVIFIIGGWKIAFPPDAQVLAQSYTDPERGWIAPVFANLITDNLGMEISDFLRYQGWLEMLLGGLLILGLVTPVVAVIMGLMYVAFAVANPIAGFIRLSRDVALMFICFALAHYGQGKYSLDKKFKKLKRFMVKGDEQIVSALIRYGLGYTLIISGIFYGGVLNNSLNSTLPRVIVIILGALFVLNLKVKWVAIVTALWMAYIVGNSLVVKKILFFAFDSVKREIGFLAASIVLAVIKRDSFLSFFKKKWR
jgi:uncharacterized membrane protein YphA (DoxX/SURF4 family)